MFELEKWPQCQQFIYLKFSTFHNKPRKFPFCNAPITFLETSLYKSPTPIFPQKKKPKKPWPLIVAMKTQISLLINPWKLHLANRLYAGGCLGQIYKSPGSRLYCRLPKKSAKKRKMTEWVTRWDRLLIPYRALVE